MAARQAPFNFLRTFALLASITIVVCALYFARAILIPLALAILLTFLLTPVVMALQRRGFNRVIAVVTVVAAAFALFAVLGWVVAVQTTSLIDSFPRYEKNLTEKIDTLRSMGRGGIIEKVQAILGRLERQMETDPETGRVVAPVDPPPQPVRIVPDDSPFNLTELWSLLGPLLEPLATAGLVVVLVMFMLIRREDMRDRLISLFGRGQLTLTTKALDDASQRIGRYLLMQFIINASFGLAVAIGLTVIGVDYALLWGFLAGTLRYIPYLGPWLAATLPLALAILITRGWTTPLLVMGLFLVLELFSNLVMEPWLYGRNVGVSVTAALVSVAFWTWLWGPIGMVLAFPLTVCLAVLGKYVPFLKFFDIMLGDQPPLEPHAGFYQRLLAKDDDEASDVAEEFFKQTALDQTYDALFVPALQMARRDLESDLIDEEEHGRMLTAMREIAEDLRARDRAIREAEGATIKAEQAAAQQGAPRVAILLCPARDETDELSLQLFEHLLDPAKCDVIVTASALLSTEVAALVEEKQIQAVCVGALPPGGLSHSRYLCMRLRARFPQVKIVVGRWGVKSNVEKNREQLQAAGADYVAFSLAEGQTQLTSAIQHVNSQNQSAQRPRPQSERLKQTA
jgi:predicted PurR-regulated permease PerM